MVSKQKISGYPCSGGLGGSQGRRPVFQILEGIEQAKDSMGIFSL